jgi:hypothetical protein
MLRTVTLALGVPGPVMASEVRRTGERSRSGQAMSPMTEHNPRVADGGPPSCLARRFVPTRVIWHRTKPTNADTGVKASKQLL